MKITDVKTYIVGNPWKNWVFIKLETGEGLYGISEATLNGFAKTVEAAIHELKNLYIGMDPFQTELIVQKMTRDVYTEGGQLHMAAVAAIEVACWDIIGKYLKQPIYNLMGGRCHEKLKDVTEKKLANYIRERKKSLPIILYLIDEKNFS